MSNGLPSTSGITFLMNGNPVIDRLPVGFVHDSEGNLYAPGYPVGGQFFGMTAMQWANTVNAEIESNYRNGTGHFVDILQSKIEAIKVFRSAINRYFSCQVGLKQSKDWADYVFTRIEYVRARLALDAILSVEGKTDMVFSRVSNNATTTPVDNK